MTKIITSIILSAVAILPVYAQEQTDTIKTQELNEVVVVASNQRTSSTVSTYIPILVKRTRPLTQFLY